MELQRHRRSSERRVPVGVYHTADGNTAPGTGGVHQTIQKERPPLLLDLHRQNVFPPVPVYLWNRAANWLSGNENVLFGISFPVDETLPGGSVALVGVVGDHVESWQCDVPVILSPEIPIVQILVVLNGWVGVVDDHLRRGVEPAMSGRGGWRGREGRKADTVTAKPLCHLGENATGIRRSRSDDLPAAWRTEANRRAMTMRGKARSSTATSRDRVIHRQSIAAKSIWCPTLSRVRADEGLVVYGNFSLENRSARRLQKPLWDCQEEDKKRINRPVVSCCGVRDQNFLFRWYQETNDPSKNKIVLDAGLTAEVEDAAGFDRKIDWGAPNRLKSRRMAPKERF
ncbi:hypothetical protein FB45DRAFT_883362 [Roridomyces roridus]|uniref:Uncharacterized protein n=1 Tax=Roridomyces roridus TaxID=1738132 RepID=A0AAD7AWY8_9AGAR|nr:hypothetical protein FB45DRAFT_883362 [Roridomyces roridus]